MCIVVILYGCRWGYRGVIIGWDEKARAPHTWIQEMHKNNPTWQHQPNYAMLVDTRDRQAPQITYVPQVIYNKPKGLKVAKEVLMADRLDGR